MIMELTNNDEHQDTEISFSVVGNVASSTKDSRVNVNIVRRYFDEDGWLSVQHIVESCKSAPWLCGECQHPLEDESSICRCS